VGARFPAGVPSDRGCDKGFAGVPRIALTATADEYTRGDILEKLDLGTPPGSCRASTGRTSATGVQLKANGKRQLLAFIRNEHPGESGIVYVRTRKRADETAAWLAEQGIDATAYHAGLEQATRMERQRRFLREPAAVMVATIAFGMGSTSRTCVSWPIWTCRRAWRPTIRRPGGPAATESPPTPGWRILSRCDGGAHAAGRVEGSEAFKRLQGRKLEALARFLRNGRVPARDPIGLFRRVLRGALR